MGIKDVLLIGLSIMAGTLIGKHIHKLGKSKDGDANVKIDLIPYATVKSNIRIPASAIYDDGKENPKKTTRKPNKFKKSSK